MYHFTFDSITYSEYKENFIPFPVQERQKSYSPNANESPITLSFAKDTKVRHQNVHNFWYTHVQLIFWIFFGGFFFYVDEHKTSSGLEVCPRHRTHVLREPSHTTTW